MERDGTTKPSYRPPRWDKARIVAALRERSANGLAMNSNAIRKSDSALCAAISRHFRVHGAALREAGIEVPGRPRLWDKAKIIAALRDRRATGLELNVAAMQDSDERLLCAMKAYFGSHDDALRAAGIDPKAVRKVIAWDRPAIVAALRDRRDKGLELNLAAIENSDLRLARAIKAHFGSHDNGLCAASIDPNAVRKVIIWDRPMVVAALHDRRTWGLGLNSGAIQKSDSRLARAMLTHFGSHDNALRAAGVDPASVRKHVAWDRATIVAVLLDRQLKGLGLNPAAVARSDGRLAEAICRHFDSHDQALHAAGLDPATVRGQVLLDKPQVIARLRTRIDAGLPLNPWIIKKSDAKLAAGVRAHFDSHDQALLAAGVDPAPRPLDEAAVIAELRDRQARSLALNYRGIRRSSTRLLSAIRRHFRSHDLALRAAGIDPASARKCTTWDKPKIIELIRKRAAEGKELHRDGIAKSDSRLGEAMMRYFPSHDEALREAGIDPDTVRVRNKWDRDSVVAALRQRQETGLGLNSSAVESNHSLHGAMLRWFGSHDAALRAAGINPNSIRKKRPRWQKNEILTALRKIARDGVVPWPLDKSAGSSLEPAAKRAFGSVQAAAVAAGLRYERPAGRGDGHWTEELVLKTLRDLHRDGRDLRYRYTKEHSQPLFFAAKQFFGSYVNAVRQAGIDYWEMSQTQLAKTRAATAQDAAGERVE